MKTAEQIIEWINDKLKELDKKEERALVNPDIESSIESIDNIHTQRMLLNNLLKYIDSPQSVIKWEQLKDNTYITNYNRYNLTVELINKYVWWWGVFSHSAMESIKTPLSSCTGELPTKERAMQKCEDYLKEIGAIE